MSSTYCYLAPSYLPVWPSSHQPLLIAVSNGSAVLTAWTAAVASESDTADAEDGEDIAGTECRQGASAKS